jgi:hypothetical protein
MANVQQDPTKIGEISATGATHYTWSDTQVPLELILYEYMVRAATSAGGVSPATAPARAAAEDNNVIVFQPPTNLVVADVLGDSGGKLALTWGRSASEGEIGPPPPPPDVSSLSDVTAKDLQGGVYECYRRTSTGTYGSLPTFTISSSAAASYVDSGLTDGTRYYGIGNEYMAILTGMALVALACRGEWESGGVARIRAIRYWSAIALAGALGLAIGHPAVGANFDGPLTARITNAAGERVIRYLRPTPASGPWR